MKAIIVVTIIGMANTLAYTLMPRGILLSVLTGVLVAVAYTVGLLDADRIIRKALK